MLEYNLQYRKYRRGKNRCLVCGYKLTDPLFLDPQHEHILEKMWARQIAADFKKELFLMKFLTNNEICQKMT
jgi:hypothetical protein